MPDDTGQHYLVVEPTDEPGHGTWDTDHDWQVEHPDGCPTIVLFKGAPGWNDVTDHDCGIGYLTREMGADEFGPLSVWGEPPFRVPIDFVFEEGYSTPSGYIEPNAYIIRGSEETADA